jgi:hypothetical protein
MSIYFNGGDKAQYSTAEVIRMASQRKKPFPKVI